MTEPRYSIRRQLFPTRLVHWLGPIVAFGFAAALAGLLLAWSGLLNLSASIPHPQGWADILHWTFEQSTARHARGIEPPAEIASIALIEKGATHYDRVCANCHGAPDLGQNAIALSMRPQPQYLMTELNDFTPSELFWIVKHGVKYSAMPAWPVGDRDDEIWAMVAFLRAMPTMDRARYRQLTQGPALAATALPPTLPPGRYRPQRYALGASDTSEPTVRYTTPALGFGHSSDMAEVAKSCVACHGADGAGRPSGAIPNIALLTREQIAEQLDHYRLGTRHSGFMQNVAVQLTPAQVDGLARYFAAQPKRRSVRVEAPPAMLALGERIATRGIPDRRVAACASCHDITRAAAKAYPGIDGQYPMYLRDQLRLYRSGVRGGATLGNPMPAAVRGLTDREIDALALYYAARAPGAPAPVAAPIVRPPAS